MSSPIVIAILAAIALGVCAALLRRELKRRKEKKGKKKED